MTLTVKKTTKLLLNTSETIRNADVKCINNLRSFVVFIH